MEEELVKYSFNLFINTKSGGGWGTTYLEKYKKKSAFMYQGKHEIEIYLYDMVDSKDRKKGLSHCQKALKNNKKLYVVICGGDGTILWVV